MIAVIAGSTGLTGALLLPRLLNDSAISKVISVTRKPLNQSHPKLQEIFIADFDDLYDHRDELKGDLYFCCLGTTIKKAGSQENFKKVDLDAVVNFGRVAEAHKAQSLTVISAMGASANSKIFYNRIKGEAEKALIELNLNRLIIMRPALLVGNRAESRPAEKLFITAFNLLSPVMGESLSHKIGTSVETLADRMLKEGKNPLHKIKIISASEI